MIQRALFDFRPLICNLLIQIHQILGHILTILEVLLINLVIILRRLQCRLLL